jgi:hypothetical protein
MAKKEDKKEEKTLDMNLDRAMDEDKALQEGNELHERMVEQAAVLSDEITSALVKKIVDSSETDNPLKKEVAILAIARTLTTLASYSFETEDEFMTSLRSAYNKMEQNVLRAILNPRPCAECAECSQYLQECSEKDGLDTKMTTNANLCLMSYELINYDLWNKVLYKTLQDRGIDITK